MMILSDQTYYSYIDLADDDANMILKNMTQIVQSTDYLDDDIRHDNNLDLNMTLDPDQLNLHDLILIVEGLVLDNIYQNTLVDVQDDHKANSFDNKDYLLDVEYLVVNKLAIMIMQKYPDLENNDKKLEILGDLIDQKLMQSDIVLDAVDDIRLDDPLDIEVYNPLEMDNYKTDLTNKKLLVLNSLVQIDQKDNQLAIKDLDTNNTDLDNAMNKGIDILERLVYVLIVLSVVFNTNVA